jgi:6-phosphofructokinase 1
MKKIGVFTSGGDAPGMNACIRAVVRACLYHKLEVSGIIRGYSGMISGEIKELNSFSVSNIIQRGGTILKSARSEEFKTKEGRAKAFENIKKHGIEGIVAIGGNGTFTGAELFHAEHGIPIVGVPGTIDNDLYGTDYTLGFDTAVNTALEALDKIRDTADSHDRVFFVEVMGRDSGYIAMECGIGGGAELVLIPERDDSIDNVINTLRDGFNRSKTSSIIIVAEGEEIGNANSIARLVKNKLKHLDIRVTTLGHIQRGGSPSGYDRTLGSRLGVAAVEGLIAGQTNVMAGMVNNLLVYTPFGDAIRKKKHINEDLMRLVNILSM